jgi:hypothetical protein
MAPKRKKDETEEMTSRERKKLKVADARTIAVQPAASASGSGGAQSSGNALAGPSSTTIRFDCEHHSHATSSLHVNVKQLCEDCPHQSMWRNLQRCVR